MQISLAASTVLNTAAPGVAAVGLDAGGSTSDSMPPFAGLLDGVMQPAALGAAMQSSSTSGFPMPQSQTATVSPEQGFATSPIMDASVPASSIVAFQPRAFFTSQSLGGAPVSRTAQPVLTAETTSQGIEGLSDSQSSPPAAAQLTANSSGSNPSTTPTSAAASKSKLAKTPSQSPDVGSSGVDPSSVIPALMPPIAPQTSVQGAQATQVQATENPTPAVSSFTPADGSSVQSPPGIGSPAFGSTVPNSTAIDSGTVDLAALSAVSQGTATPKSASVSPGSADQLQTDVVQPPSPLSSAEVSAAPQLPSPLQVADQTPSAAQTSLANAVSSPVAPPSSSAQPPSAVAQFTGRPRSGSASPLGIAKPTTVTARTQTAPTSSPSGSPSGLAQSAAGSSNNQDLDDDASTSNGSQTGGQNGQALSQDISASSAAPSDGSPQQISFPTSAPTVANSDPVSSAGVTSATVANLSAQIAQKSGGQTTRFDVQLDPAGLGRVNVSVEIDANGAMSAALSFEKPEAASLLKSHSAELQQSLAQAGFDLSSSALSFSTVDPDGRSASNQAALLGGGADGGGQQSQGGQAQSAGRAFGAASLAATEADQITTAARTLSARGLDIRI